MNSYCLGFKYVNIKTCFQYGESQLSNTGWKCRKYKNWKAVHVADDRDILDRFATAAIELSQIDLEALPRINEILLNVQKWRIDKEHLQIEPRRETVWEKALAILSAAHESPGIVLSYLRDNLTGLDEVDTSQLPTLLGRLLLVQIVDSSLGKDVTNVGLGLVQSTFSEFVLQRSNEGFDLRELQRLEKGEDINSYLMQFGLPEIILKQDFDYTDIDTHRGSPIVSVEYAPLDTTLLYKFDEFDAASILHLNSNNSLIQRLLKSDDSFKEMIVKILICEALVESELPEMADSFSARNTRLALKLNREFRE